MAGVDALEIFGDAADGGSATGGFLPTLDPSMHRSRYRSWSSCRSLPPAAAASPRPPKPASPGNQITAVQTGMESQVMQCLVRAGDCKAANKLYVETTWTKEERAKLSPDLLKASFEASFDKCKGKPQ